MEVRTGTFRGPVLLIGFTCFIGVSVSWKVGDYIDYMYFRINLVHLFLPVSNGAPGVRCMSLQYLF